ncbi:MAG TPA: hypothetical protein VG455_00560 [Acidimicrobiales bacterium]|nr:hypothetical protein [Acidimicrobiales bacterium]
MAQPGTIRAGEAPPFPADLPPAENRPRPDAGVIASLGPSLAIGTLGVVLVLAGLAWDALVHAADPGRHEDVFTVANPAHLCLMVGVATTVVGIVLATTQVLRGRSWGRASTTYLTVMGVVVALAAASLGWAGWTEARHGSEGGSAAGALLMDDHGHTEDCRPSREDREAAARLLDDTRAGTARFQSIAIAAAEGYRSGSPAPLPTDHYVNAAHLTDGKVLDPARPEALMYTLTAHGPILVGAMYLTNQSGEAGPEVGGCLTRWHVHDNLCFAPDTLAISGFTSDAGECPSGLVHLVPPAALHVWLLDVPGGPFAAEMDAEFLAARLGP